MNKFPLSPGTKLSMTGSLLAALGILTLFAFGIAVQDIPVGAIVLLVLTALVGLRIWPWMPVITGAFCLFVTAGGFIAPPGFIYRVTHPGETVAFIGSTVQIIGLLLGMYATFVVIKENTSRGARRA